MKTLKILLSSLFIVYSSSLTFAQTWQWAVKDSDNGTQGCDAQAICVDSAGNSYITGSMDGYPTYFSSCGTYSNSDYRFFYIAKYNSSGICQWVQTAGGHENGAYGNAIAIDRRGNLLVTGWFSDSITFGTTNLIGNSIFVVKYDNNGNVKWAKGCSGNGGPGYISVDKTGNVYFSADANGIFSTFVLSNVGQIVKLDSNGNCIWVKDTNVLMDWLQTDSIGNSYVCNNGVSKYDSSGRLIWAKNMSSPPTAIGIDKWDNIYTSGFGTGNISFGCDTLNLGSGSPFIAKFDMNGNCIWDKLTGGYLYVTAMGTIYLASYFASSASVGTCSVSGGPGLFIAELDSAGNCQWIQSALGNSGPEGIACDYSGNCYIGGEIYGNTTFGSITLTNPSSPMSILVAKLSAPTTGTGHSPVRNSTTFNIYPNPSAGGYNLEISPSLLNSKLTIYDTQGKVVFQAQIVQQNPQINIPSLAKGMYYVQLITPQGQSMEKTIVQQ